MGQGINVILGRIVGICQHPASVEITPVSDDRDCPCSSLFRWASSNIHARLALERSFAFRCSQSFVPGSMLEILVEFPEHPSGATPGQYDVSSRQNTFVIAQRCLDIRCHRNASHS